MRKSCPSSERERGRTPKLEIDSITVGVVPLTADQAKIDSTADLPCFSLPPPASLATHVTDLPFSLYPCRANHRKTSDPPWPSHLHRAILSLPPLNRTQLLLSLPSSLNLTRFYEFFLFGFIFFVFIYWEMILYICLEAEKMWATSRKCVFYNIFKNTTKY